MYTESEYNSRFDFSKNIEILLIASMDWKKFNHNDCINAHFLARTFTDDNYELIDYPEVTKR